MVPFLIFIFLLLLPLLHCSSTSPHLLALTLSYLMSPSFFRIKLVICTPSQAVHQHRHPRRGPGHAPAIHAQHPRDDGLRRPRARHRAVRGLLPRLPGRGVGAARRRGHQDRRVEAPGITWTRPKVRHKVQRKVQGVSQYKVTIESIAYWNVWQKEEGKEKIFWWEASYFNVIFCRRRASITAATDQSRI
jgi:hypothetical protein